MSYYVQTRWGCSEDAPSVSRMREILDELETDDPEHPDCWLGDEKGRVLIVYQSGLVSFGISDSARHLINVSREKSLKLWLLLIEGDIQAIEKEVWQPGHAPPRTREEQEHIEQEAAKFTLDMDRQFYESLGDERPNKPCRREGCSRGSVNYSVLCRVHHFESIRGHPSPFSY